MEKIIIEVILSAGGALLVFWLKQLSIKVNEIDKRIREAPSREEMYREIEVRQESLKVLQQEIKEDIKELKNDIKKLINNH